LLRAPSAQQQHNKDDLRIMTINFIAAALAATTIAAGSPAIASAETTAPVAITDVQNTPSLGYLNTYNPGLLTVSFKNTSDVAATDVIFELASGNKFLDSYEDAGSFAKGVAVTHSFNNIQTALNQRVAIAEVKFADGSVWVNSSVPDVHPLRQAADESNVSAFINEDF
jgi:hypothetical protein